MDSHVHAPVIRSNAEIMEQAREIHPVQFAARTLMTTIAAVFIGAGAVVGTLWFSAVFSVLWTFNRVKWTGQCFRYGFHKGSRAKVVPKDQG
jgi:ABC-type transport system involved in cytochrome c biogenesis permease subunit